MKNAADPKQVNEAKDKERREANNLADDIHFLMTHKQGQRFIWKVLCECGVYKLSFDSRSGSNTYFNEGARDIGQKIIAMLTDAEPTYYPKLMIAAHEGGFGQ